MTGRRNSNCIWCRRPLAWNRKLPGGLQPTRDHIVPRSLGGTDKRWCCLACNQIKGDMTPFQWEQFREKVPNWWLLYPTVKYRGLRLYCYVIEGLTPIHRLGQ